MRSSASGASTARRELDEAREPPRHRGLRHARVGALRQLTRRERRVAQPELCRLAQRRGQALEQPRRRGAASAASRLRARRRRSAARGSRGRRSPAGSPRRAGRRRAPAPRARPRCRSRPATERKRLDRVPALRVRGGVLGAVDHAEPDACGRGHAAHERRAGVRRRPHLEVRVTRAAERAGAEERAAQVRGPAARARDDVPCRPLERRRRRDRARRPRRAPRARASDRLRRRAGSGSRGRRRGWRYVRISRVDPQRAQQRERAARDRRLAEVEAGRRSLPGRGGATVPAVWNSADSLGEPVAAPGGRDRGELGAREPRRAAGRSQPSTPSSASRRRFEGHAVRAVAADPVGRDHAVARKDERDAARRRRSVPAARAAPGRPASAASSP